MITATVNSVSQESWPKSIVFRDEMNSEWKVLRSQKDLQELNEYLFRHEYINESLSERCKSADADADIEEYLNQTLASVHGNIWENDKLISFLDNTRDDDNKANVTHYLIRAMKNKISSLMKKTDKLQDTVNNLETASTKLLRMFEALTRNLPKESYDMRTERLTHDNIQKSRQANEQADNESPSASDMTVTSPSSSAYSSSTENSSDENEGGEDGRRERRKKRQQQQAKQEKKLHDKQQQQQQQQQQNNQQQGSAGQCSTDGDNSGSKSGSGGSEQQQTISPLTSYVNSQAGSKENSGSRDTNSRDQDSVSTPEQIYAMCTMSPQADIAAETIEMALQPHDNQIYYRYSATGFVKKHIRLAINATGFESGLQNLRCNLPDDPIRITTIICKNMLSNWHKLLCDGLTELSFQSEAESQQPQYLYYELLDPEYSPAMQHKISKAVITSDQMLYKVHCTVDEQVEVEITMNGREELCMLAFIEEVADMIGRNNLFKRSLLLIRAWWVYETASYVGCPIKHYLSDFTVCIMLCAIFNQYHAQITTPMQALCLFMTEYAAYDGSTQAITIQGIYSFEDSTGGQLKAKSANQQTSGFLISEQLMERFQNVFIVTPLPAGSSKSTSGTAIDENVQRAHGASVIAKNTTQFARYGFNVIHPFLKTNMVTDKIASRRVARMSKAFQSGSRCMAAVLQQITVNTPTEDVKSLVASFFSVTTSKYVKTDKRLDTLVTSTSEEFIRSSLKSSTAKLWQNILYCNLVMESILVESALLTLTCEILAEKGALPVGEVGKTLTEMTGISNLSQKLKEKFGGLKKFLEKFQDLFIFSNDHPFNPHVLLRCGVSPDQLYMIDAGLFPSDLITKSKKRGVPAFNTNSVSIAAAKQLIKLPGEESKDVDERSGTGTGSNSGGSRNAGHSQAVSIADTTSTASVKSMPQQQQQQKHQSNTPVVSPTNAWQQSMSGSSAAQSKLSSHSSTLQSLTASFGGYEDSTRGGSLQQQLHYQSQQQQQSYGGSGSGSGTGGGGSGSGSGGGSVHSTLLKDAMNAAPVSYHDYSSMFADYRQTQTNNNTFTSNSLSTSPHYSLSQDLYNNSQQQRGGSSYSQQMQQANYRQQQQMQQQSYGGGGNEWMNESAGGGGGGGYGRSDELHQQQQQFARQNSNEFNMQQPQQQPSGWRQQQNTASQQQPQQQQQSRSSRNMFESQQLQDHQQQQMQQQRYDNDQYQQQQRDQQGRERQLFQQNQNQQNGQQFSGQHQQFQQQQQSQRESDQYQPRYQSQQSEQQYGRGQDQQQNLYLQFQQQQQQQRSQQQSNTLQSQFGMSTTGGGGGGQGQQQGGGGYQQNQLNNSNQQGLGNYNNGQQQQSQWSEPSYSQQQQGSTRSMQQQQPQHMQQHQGPGGPQQLQQQQQRQRSESDEFYNDNRQQSFFNDF